MLTIGFFAVVTFTSDTVTEKNCIGVSDIGTQLMQIFLGKLSSLFNLAQTKTLLQTAYDSCLIF